MRSNSWLELLADGVPSDFDFGHIRGPSDAQSFIFRLPNEHRGTGAAALHRHRDHVGRPAVFAGMIAAWEHDHGHVIAAFGYSFLAALREVAPPVTRSRRLRLWRGLQLPADGGCDEFDALGVSWTRCRDVACWFAMQFDFPNTRPVVLEALLDPNCIVAFWNGRREGEVIVDPLSVDVGDFWVEGAPALSVNDPVPDQVVARWRLAQERELHRRAAESESRLAVLAAKFHGERSSAPVISSTPS